MFLGACACSHQPSLMEDLDDPNQFRATTLFFDKCTQSPFPDCHDDTDLSRPPSSLTSRTIKTDCTIGSDLQ